jgi:hypothetical protein
LDLRQIRISPVRFRCVSYGKSFSFFCKVARKWCRKVFSRTGFTAGARSRYSRTASNVLRHAPGYIMRMVRTLPSSADDLAERQDACWSTDDTSGLNGGPWWVYGPNWRRLERPRGRAAYIFQLARLVQRPELAKLYWAQPEKRFSSSFFHRRSSPRPPNAEWPRPPCSPAHARPR